MSKPPAAAKRPPSPFGKSELNKCLRAAAEGDTQYLRAMLKRGLDPNLAYKGGDNLRPLCSAARHGQLAVARLLLDAGADPNAQDSWLGMPPHGTPLENAAENGHLDIIRLLLNRGADIEKQGFYTPLRTALSFHQNKVVRFLLGAGAHISAADLGQAVGRGNIDGAKMLIEAGAEVNAPNKDGEVSLHIGAYSSRPEMTALLIKAGAHLDHAESLRGRTPLHVAVLTERVENVRLLLDAGANPTIKDKSGLTPLHYAEHWGHEACAELLHEAMVGRKVTPTLKTRRAIKLLKDQSLEYLGHESGLKSK